MGTISIEDFKKLDIRTALIESVEPHPNADRLYVIGIRVGDIQKAIVAGIRPFYEADSLLGKTIVIVHNLEPCVIRGVESQGMLLAVSDENTLAVLTPEKPMADGLGVG